MGNCEGCNISQCAVTAWCAVNDRLKLDDQGVIVKVGRIHMAIEDC